ncbi:MAG TPA: S8 family peptidase [Acidimicrobiales bacterium]|nr:S8 family peptidase [Acidimicrobiales bacterium]
MSQAAHRATHRSVAWRHVKALGAATTVCLGVATAVVGTVTQSWAGATLQYIVQGSSSRAAAAEVRTAHGDVLSSLPLVHGVVAKLTGEEAAAARQAGLQVSPNLQLKVDSISLAPNQDPSSNFGEVTGASTLLSEGYNGQGVTVAVLDTGIDAKLPDFRGRVVGGVNLSGTSAGWNSDQYGHGTFVAGIIASNGAASNGQFTGIAPGADLVSIKVAGASGVTSESTVIEGVTWAIDNESTYGIQVLNISLGVEPSEPSAFDPLDQAVEQAWQSGIVVVTSAGNAGPDNGSITSPGDDPVVLTVGALNDGGLGDAATAADYTIPSFSSTGPTLYDGWFKPDLVAPGRSIISVMAPGSTIYDENPTARIGLDNFVGSGTSFSAAMVSGLVALLLEAEPGLTPDQVKAALLFSASPGPIGDPFVDGHGIADVASAVSVAGQVSLNQSPVEEAESAEVAAGAGSTTTPAAVSLSATWAESTWNPANWSGAAWNASPPDTDQGATTTGTGTGLTWNGAAWNGAAWNGAAWNGAAWNGAAWNGAAWNDQGWS